MRGVCPLRPERHEPMIDACRRSLETRGRRRRARRARRRLRDPRRAGGSGARVPAAPRPGSARPARRSPSSRSQEGEGAAGDQRDDRGEGRRVDRDGRDAALEKRRAEVPDEVTQFLRLPGLGRRPPRGSGGSSASRPSTAPRGGGATARPHAAGARREERGEDPGGPGQGLGPEPERRGLLGQGLPVVRQVVDALRAHPALVDVSAAGVRRGRETFRDLDVIATNQTRSR